MQKTCKHCQNHFPEEEVKTHEANCAVNPDVQEKTRKLGEIEKYVKTAVIHDGEIVRLYWAHSTGAQDFDIESIFKAWRKVDPNVNYHSVPFLKARGFTVVVT